MAGAGPKAPPSKQRVREAQQASKARVKAAAKPKKPETLAEHRTVERARAGQRARQTIARRAAVTPEGAAVYAAGKASSAARSASQARLPLGDRSYQPVILAEYLLAIVIIVLTPIATGGSANAQAKSSPSPYDTGDLRQLVAASAVYFILSLASSGNRGRYSAWLGGLVLLVLLLARVKSVPAIVGTITGTSAAQQPAADSSGSGGGGHAEAQ